jgi:hypothetical protein
MSEEFDGAREPMRALRDLINACEGIFGDDNGEQAILSRAQAGFDSLRKLFGDTRLAEDTAHGPMIEPTATVLFIPGTIDLAELQRIKVTFKATLQRLQVG